MSTNNHMRTKQALIVLGMHRSGTSAMSGVLARLGAQVPNSLMPPTPDNPKGYWESTEFMKLHDRILDSAGTRWSDWDAFNPEWINSTAGGEFLGDVSQLLESEFGEASLILVKDPRLCRMFPVMSTALDHLGVSPKVVMTVRHPLEVAKSLETRDQLARNQSKLAWLRHMLDAEFSTRGIARTFVNYSALLHDWRLEIDKISRDLDIKWPRRSAAAEAEIEAYLAPELRHHAAEESVLPSHLGIAGWIAGTYESFQSLTTQPDSPEALRELDKIRSEFNKASGIFAPVVHEQRQMFEHEAVELQRSAARLSSEYQTLDSRHKALVQENLENYRLYSEHREAMEQLRKDCMERDAVYVAMASKYEVERADMAKKYEALETEMVDRIGEIRQLKDALRRSEESVQERFIETAQLTKTILGLENAVAKQQVSFQEERKSWSLHLENEIDEQRRLILDYRTHFDRVYSGNRWRAAIVRRVSQAPAMEWLKDDDRSDEEVLRGSNLFDSDWYLKRYPDVRSKGMDPIKHYLKYGAREGRDPCRAFHTASYVSRYPDVSSAGVNPLVHYIKYGRQEGRAILQRRKEV